MNHIIKNITYILIKANKYCKFRIISIIILALLDGINAVNIALFFKFAIDSVTGKKSLTFLILVICIYISIWFIKITANNYFTNVKYPIWDGEIKKGISKEVYSKSLEIDLIKIDNPDFYDKYTRALKEADNRTIEIYDTIKNFLSNLLSTIGLLSTIAVLDKFLFIFAFIPVIISFFINISITKNRFDYETTLTNPLRKIDYIRRIFYLPQYSKELRMNNYLNLLFEKYDEAALSFADVTNQKMPNIINKSVFGAWQFTTLNFGIPALYIGWKVLNNNMGIGDFSSLLIAVANLSSYFFYMVLIIPQFTQHSLFIDNLRIILEYECIIKPNPNLKQISASMNHSIELKNVSFYYPSNNKNVLNGISLKINAGEKVAFVGENGAGKTTITKLLLRLYDPTEGELILDDSNYKYIDVESLRNSISIVFQDFQYFALSIGENIMCKRINEKNNDKLWNSLKASGLYNKIRNLPKRINTPLTNEFEEDGISLSGGECQKLAISRADIKDSGIIILDEPSSSLDPLSEYEMYESIFKLYKNKTLILISHRLYSTKMVDKIFFIENGKILEEGNHEQLMKLDGKYAHMYKLQANQYKL